MKLKFLREKTFHQIFLIRLFGHFFVLSGIIVLVLIIEPVISEESKYNLDQLTGKRYRLTASVITSASFGNQNPTTSSAPAPTPETSQGFGSLLGVGSSETIVPASTDFGIVIEKINANAKVIANVDAADEKAYGQALAGGVAHAKGTGLPGDGRNIYLFSHSTDAPWNIVRFNAIFYLLGKMEVNDTITLFYQGRRYDYKVFDKTITKPDDVSFIKNTYETEVLTLQTCDPPGTLLNRLIIRAKLVSNS